ncbi:MAG: hypothetical protein LBQ59_03810 [Candidatus Peribacteria bacterium]|nr:hypothetical protein [Candidatus Peribacteria bacterium]
MKNYLYYFTTQAATSNINHLVAGTSKSLNFSFKIHSLYAKSITCSCQEVHKVSS